MKRQPGKKRGDFGKDRDGSMTGTTFGAANGVIAGGVLGSLAGPGGTVVGAIAGAVAGGVIGHVVGAGGGTAGGIQEHEAYWEKNFHLQDFHATGMEYADYAPALRLGYAPPTDLAGKTFTESEPRLKEEWERTKGGSRLSWEQARHAIRSAWERVEASSSPRTSSPPVS